MERPSFLTAVSKLAIAGEQAGFTLEEMIQLLNSGVSVETLLHLIAQRLEGEIAMGDRAKWMELCAQAAIETDPENFLFVAEQIVRLLKDKEARLNAQSNSPASLGGN